MSRVRLAFSPILGAAVASGALIAALGYFLPTAPAQADLLIVAPHPDDDLITAAGVIARAREADENVWVLFMTNGDVLGKESGLKRQDEEVEALALLDVPEDNIIFLGYPDGSLEDLYKVFTDSSAARPAAGPDHQTTTFGERGLGRADYHRHAFGSHADNNGANVRKDLQHMLSTYRPSHIFVTAEWDQHPDHRTTYEFVTDSLKAVRHRAPAYDPTIHKTIVWNNFSNQPEWPAAAAPQAYFTEPPRLRERTGLIWAERESLDVPLSMQSAVLTENLKWRAIDAHNTQGGNNGYIGQFVHKDEFFWTLRASESELPPASQTSRPPVPDAGLDQTAERGARVALDGSASFDPDGTPLSYLWRRVEGPEVALSNAGSAHASFTVPSDAAPGSVFVFELKVGDATSISVADAVSVRVE